MFSSFTARLVLGYLAFKAQWTSVQLLGFTRKMEIGRDASHKYCNA